MTQTITYRGPPVLAGALAHLLRVEGLELDRPRDDRTVVAEVVVVEMTVRAAETALSREAMIGAAVARFTGRFGEDSASIEVADSDDLSSNRSPERADSRH
jgi:hypothetical protein